MSSPRSATRLVGCLIFLAVATDAAGQEAYNHNRDTGFRSTGWMSNLKDTATLSQLSIPGTHDSIAYDVNGGGDAVWTQWMPLRTQLDAGIRFLDIRLKCQNDALWGYHGISFQFISFNTILDVIREFLTVNPRETVYARIKNEEGSFQRDQRCQGLTLKYQTFHDAILAYFNGDFEPLFWKPTTETLDPTLAVTRGKLVVLRDFPCPDGKFCRFGLEWNKYGSQDIQDEYQLRTNWDLHDRKWGAVKRQLVRARDAAGQATHPIFINFLSGSGGSFPYFVASGKSSPRNNAPRLSTGKVECITTNRLYPDFPRLSCAWAPWCGKSSSTRKHCSVYFEGVNMLTWQWLNNNNTRYTGIVPMDFPGGDLIRAIVTVNDRTLREDAP
jgi:1-phosphatidylinositol phosphodiesterase